MGQNVTIKVKGVSTNFSDVKQVEIPIVGGGTAVYYEESEISGNLENIEITTNGEYSASGGYFGIGTVTVNVPSLAGFPVEISSEAGMTAFLATAQSGQIVRYTGTSGTYINGSLYEVE